MFIINGLAFVGTVVSFNIATTCVGWLGNGYFYSKGGGLKDDSKGNAICAIVGAIAAVSCFALSYKFPISVPISPERVTLNPESFPNLVNFRP